MANRFLLKQFAEQATNTGVFGSYQAGNPTYSTDPSEIQSLPAWLMGWLDATTGGTYLPRLEEMQGLQKVLCQAIIENYREGVPVWIAGETYYKNSVVSYEGTAGFDLYYNITGTSSDQNPEADTANWANLAGLFVTKEYVDQNFLGINRVTNSVLQAKDNSSFSSLSNVSFVNEGASVTNNIAGSFGRYGVVLLAKPMLTSSNWSFVFSFETNDVNTKQSIIAMPTLPSGIGIENGNLFLGLNDGNLTSGNITITPQTLYYVKLTYNDGAYKVELSTDNVNWNTDITVESSQQPFGGKTISLGNGGADYPDNWLRGSINMNDTTIRDGDTVYWDVSTQATVHLIHFNGIYGVIAPDGRDVTNNLNNVSFTTTLNNYMNYTLVNGTKTVLLREDGEIMARQGYTESTTQPASANLLDVWFNPNTNVMYEFSSQQPNFNNSGVTVTKGIASGFTSSNSLLIESVINPSEKITLSVNTRADVTTKQDYYSWGTSTVYVENDKVYYDTRVTGYEVGINTGTSAEPVWTEQGYVPMNGNDLLPTGTEVYSDPKCSVKLADATGTDYSYTGVTSEETVSCNLAVTPNQVYFVDCGYIGENYTLMVGTQVSEVTAMATISPANSITINGENPILGTVNLANISLPNWKWNGVSTVATNWNRIVAGRLGTISDNGTTITSLNMDKPLQLAKQTDLEETERRIINIMDMRFQVVSALPATPEANTFYFIPE